MAFTPPGTKNALPSDMISTDENGNRRLNVNADIPNAILSLESSNLQILEQLRLLNLRIEEAFSTGLTGKDID